MKWRRAQHGPISGELNDYLMSLIDAEIEKGNTLKFCVGTDSQKNGRGYKFASVIVMEIKEPMGKDNIGKTIYQGRGAMVVYNTFHEPHMRLGEKTAKELLNERMMREVQATVEVASEIYPLLALYNLDLELHADINQNPRHGSNVALNSAIGYMSGIPCTVRIKPDAYAASTGADKLC